MSKRQKEQKRLDYREVIPRFFLIFFAIGIILAATITIFYRIETKDYISQIQNKEIFSLELQRQLVVGTIRTAVADLKFLSNQNEMLQILHSQKSDLGAKIARLHLEYIKEKKLYDEITFFDEQGIVLSRVSFNSGNPIILSQEKMPLDNDHEHFQRTISLARGDVFISPFTLSRIGEKIEKPLKPIIRFSTPVFDITGQQRGVMMIHYLGLHLFASMKNASQVSQGELMLLNSNAFWLLSSMPENEWGFLLKGREDHQFSRQFPEAWQQIVTKETHQFINKNGMFTSTTIFPLAEGGRSNAGSDPKSPKDKQILTSKDYFWKLVSYIPKEVLHSKSGELLKELGILAAVLFLLSALPSWMMAEAIMRRKLDQMNLWRNAVFDNLTGLPNRSFFQAGLEKTLLEAERYHRQFALLFMDLDDFKSVNDNFGHDAGDLVLKETSSRLLICLRKSDTVARLGGDEFTILLPEVMKKEDVEVVAKKIILAFSLPFNIRNTEKSLGISIGIALYPKDGKEVESLLKNADTAMYQAKMQGKNKYQFLP